MRKLLDFLEANMRNIYNWVKKNVEEEMGTKTKEEIMLEERINMFGFTCFMLGGFTFFIILLLIS